MIIVSAVDDSDEDEDYLPNILRDESKEKDKDDDFLQSKGIYNTFKN